MRIEEMHWRQVEDLLTHEDRAVLPLGCTEQHAGLSLSTDSILASRVAVEAAEPLQVPVFPVLGYGLTPSFTAYPGTVTLRSPTYLAVIRDLVDGILRQGFRRLLIVNGHGGNAPARAMVQEVLADHPNCLAIWHDWWIGPRTWSTVTSIDPDASHASWMENFPWTRLQGSPAPTEKKPMVRPSDYRQAPPHRAREVLGDGSFGGLYQRSDEEMLRIWQTAVEETREMLADGWLKKAFDSPPEL